MYFFCLHWSLFIAVISYGNEWNKRVGLSESFSQSDWIKANSTGVSCQSQSHSNKHIQLSNSHKKISPNPSTASSFPILFLLCMHTSHGKIQSKSIEIIYKAFIMQANMCIHIILLLFNLLCKRAHKTCFKVLAAWHQNVMYLIINEFTTKLIRTYQCMYITKSPFLRSSWLNLKLLKIRYSVSISNF